jgi:hypothetical protein
LPTPPGDSVAMRRAGTWTSSIRYPVMAALDEKAKLRAVAQALVAGAEASENPEIRAKLMGWAASAINAIRVIDEAQAERRDDSLSGSPRPPTKAHRRPGKWRWRRFKRGTHPLASAVARKPGLDPDAWPRFEKAAKVGPQHRSGKTVPASSTRQGGKSGE